MPHAFYSLAHMSLQCAHTGYFLTFLSFIFFPSHLIHLFHHPNLHLVHALSSPHLTLPLSWLQYHYFRMHWHNQSILKDFAVNLALVPIFSLFYWYGLPLLIYTTTWLLVLLCFIYNALLNSSYGLIIFAITLYNNI